MNSSAQVSGNGIVRQEFNGKQIQKISETAISAVEAQARAAVNARYIMAMQRPRDWDKVRSDLLRECRRPSFARAAEYDKPIGNGISGPTIRFAEAAIRCMTNLLVETPAIYDDHEKRILRVAVTDLESNTTYHKDVTVSKTVERKKLRKGQEPLGVRTNSFGDRLYIVRATDDEILNKEGALVSKALRTLALRVLPGHLVDEAMEVVHQTLREEAAKDPKEVRKKLIEFFRLVGVSESDLTNYIGHSLEGLTPEEIKDLRLLWMSIRDGEVTWEEAMKQRGLSEAPNRKLKEKANRETKGGTADLKEKLGINAQNALNQTAPQNHNPANPPSKKTAKKRSRRDSEPPSGSAVPPTFSSGQEDEGTLFGEGGAK